MAGQSVTDAEGSEAGLFTATYVEVARSSAARAATLLAREQAASASDAGLARLEILRRVDRPNQFVALVAWRDRAALEAHVASPRVADLTRELEPLLIAPSDRREHVALTLAPPRAAPASSHPSEETGPPTRAAAPGKGRAAVWITAVTHVDVVPTYKDDAVAALQRLAENSRREGGNLRFDVWQQTNRPNHFTVVETWSSRRALDAHAAAPNAREFRSALGPMAGALYDERLFKPLG